MILIKLGGSVITDKNVPYTFKRRRTTRLINEIASSTDNDFIVVHGGGSFGHPGAEKFELNTKDPKNVAEATSKVQNHMRVLNNRIIEMMIDERLPAVSIPGGIVTKYTDGKLRDLNSDIFHRYIDIGTVPVTFGDVALDEKRKVTICSGDDLMLGLCEKAEKAIFVSNVDGIYKKGELVYEFTEEMYPLVKKDIKTTETSIDVTGGMNRKVEKMLEISENCRTFVINGSKKDRLKRMLNGKDTVSTEVKR